MPAEKSKDKSRYSKTTKPILDDYDEEKPSKSKSYKEPEVDVSSKKSRDESKKSSRKTDFALDESDSKQKRRSNESNSAESSEKEKHRSKNRDRDREAEHEDDEKKSSSRHHRKRDDNEEKESRHHKANDEEDRDRRHHKKREDETERERDRDKDRDRRHGRKDEEDKKESRHQRKDEEDREKRHHRKRDEDDENREKHRSKSKYEDEESSSRRHREKKYDDNDESDRKKDKESSSRRHNKSNEDDSDYSSSRKHKSSSRRDEEEEKKTVKKEPIIQEEEEEDAVYDEDFENDFEDDSESEKQIIKKEEPKPKKVYSSDEDTKNKSSKSKRNNKYDYDDEPVRIVKANALVKVPTEKVEFYSSKIYFNHDSLDRQQRRAKDLLKTIELDKKSFSILDIDPTEMRTSFSSHLKHEKCQTNDDVFEIEIQTDDIDYVTRWTQYPPEDSKGYGTEDPYNRGESADDNILEKFRLDINVNDLQTFLSRAAKVIETILIENNSETIKFTLENKSDIQFSQGFSRFSIPKFLSKLTKQAVLTNCCFSRDDSNYFLCSYDIQTIPDKEGRLNASLIIVWNINEATTPYRVLICESSSQCICYSSFMIFSGNSDGSVCVWDLREPSNMHKFNYKTKSLVESNVVRTPTYSTAGVLLNENHLSEIKSIIPLHSQIKNQDKNVFMQIATLELECKLIIWTVVELSHIDLAGFETDLGLLPGGRIKLVKSSQIDLNNLVRMPYGKVKYQTLAMTSPSNRTNHFFICTNIGNILHITRENETSSTTTLRSEFSEGNLQVTCAAFHPELEDILLAGYGNGELRLYHVNYFVPIKTWTFGCQSNRVNDLYWLPSRNSAFLVIDETGVVYLWDLLADDTQPIYNKSINNLGGFNLSHIKQTVNNIEDKENSSNLPFVTFNLNSKELEVHLFTPDLSQKSEKESKKFAKFLKNLLITF